MTTLSFVSILAAVLCFFYSSIYFAFRKGNPLMALALLATSMFCLAFFGFNFLYHPKSSSVLWYAAFVGQFLPLFFAAFLSDLFLNIKSKSS